MPEREGNRAFMEKREQKRKRVIALAGLGLFVVFSVTVFWFVGKPMLQFVSQPDQFRDWVDTHGIWGRLAFLGMVMFQVFVAIIPASRWKLAPAMPSARWKAPSVHFGYHNQQRGHFPGGEKVWHELCHSVCLGGENSLAEIFTECPAAAPDCFSAV